MAKLQIISSEAFLQQVHEGFSLKQTQTARIWSCDAHGKLSFCFTQEAATKEGRSWTHEQWGEKLKRKKRKPRFRKKKNESRKEVKKKSATVSKALIDKLQIDISLVEALEKVSTYT